MQRRTEWRATKEEAALRLVQEHAAELIRFARRFSICADDAHDAYQRSLEILVRRMRTAPPDEPLKWLRTVLRHEAYTVRKEREQLVSREEVDLDRHEGRHLEDPAERLAAAERLDRVAEALQRLKPQEVTGLVLRAEGLSYKEICARTGWTYTKVNRCVTEGRRALLDRLGAIESGAECERWLPLLSALADGEASLRQRAELRPHLRGCSACRATLREFHTAPSHVAALVPAALVPFATGDPGSVAGHVAAVTHAVVERLTFAAARFQGGFDALSGTKVAAVAASTAAIAGGGAVIEQAVDAPAHPPAPRARVADVPMRASISLPALTTRSPARSSAPSTPAHREAVGAGEFAPEAPSSSRPPSSARVSAAVAAQAPTPPAPQPDPGPPSEFAGP